MGKRITDLIPLGGSPGGGLSGSELLEIAIPGSPSLSRSILVGALVDHVLGILGTSALLDSDADGALTANSDALLPTQKAVRTYIAATIASADVMVYKGVIDCSANPNYPAADAGHVYIISVAGKIGGASGVVVEVGDLAVCRVDSTASGNQATVGANWNILQTNITAAGSLVTSVAGKTGSVTLDHNDLTDWTEAVQDVIGALLISGSGIYASYDDAGNALTLGTEQKTNAQTGTTYTLVGSDRAKRVTLSNASSIALTIPQGGSAGFPDGWWCEIEQLGAGVVTGTPTSSTVDGGATVVTVGAKTGYKLSTDGTNWFTTRGLSSSGFTGGTLTSALNEAPIVSIAAGGTMNIGAAAANVIDVTGSGGPITAFDTVASGIRRILLFASTPTWTHNATSMKLPGGANITIAAGDRAEVVSLGSGNWECVFFQRAASLGGGGSGGAFTYASSAPGSPTVGDRWVDSVNGILLTYIYDGATYQWVEF